MSLLGGLSPSQFMRRYWQRKPYLIRQAMPAFKPPITLATVKQLARRDNVESRLIWREGNQWHIEHGPFARLPKASEPNWTLLVQSVNLHSDAAAEWLQQFRFVPDTRLDDLMISIATDGGGVGPHFDSYDVFLVQAIGQRRWRISRQKDLALVPDLPLKILSRFKPDEEHVLDPGDMLYLPPHVAHDGIAIGDCMTLSIGFRAPLHATLARGLLEAAADQVTARVGLLHGPYSEPLLPGPRLDTLYRDTTQGAVACPAAIPDNLVATTLATVEKLRFDDALASRFLGCWLTEPSQLTVFERRPKAVDVQGNWPRLGRLVLDRRSRMLYRGKQLFINGETALVTAEPALRALADQRALMCNHPVCQRLTPKARACLADWLDAGWLHYHP
jgi:50S ribosomal protein L16 3-hydroxylase